MDWTRQEKQRRTTVYWLGSPSTSLLLTLRRQVAAKLGKMLDLLQPLLYFRIETILSTILMSIWVNQWNLANRKGRPISIKRYCPGLKPQQKRDYCFQKLSSGRLQRESRGRRRFSQIMLSPGQGIVLLSELSCVCLATLLPATIRQVTSTAPNLWKMYLCSWL